MKNTALYDYEPTQIYPDLVEKTQVQGLPCSERHGIEVWDEIELNAQKYRVLNLISEDSGEATIYKVQNLQGEIFALKMYFEFTRIQDEPNPESLRRILKITDSDLLKLHDFGTGKDKYQQRFCFEISDFAEGNDLLSVPNFQEKYTVNFLETKVIPQIFKGIKILHRNRIFHCDLKPQNVFFSNVARTNLVIGDYGSAKTFTFENGKDARKTSTVKGTDFYLPPEQARGFISEKNDYYSFGMILLHLTYPEKVCQLRDFSRLSRVKLKQIIEKQFANEPIIDFSPEKGRINDLIAGLTLNNVADRWGEVEVSRWLKGEKVAIKKSIQNSIKTINPIDLGDRIIRTEKDFVYFLEQDEEWFELLFEDRTGRQLFNRWLLSLRTEEEYKEVIDLIKKYQQNGIEFIKEALLRFFDPLRPLRLEDQWIDLYMVEDLKFETAYFLGQLSQIEMTDNALKIEVFKYYQFFKNQENNPNFNPILRIFEEAKNQLDAEAKEIPKTKLIRAWVLNIIWRLAHPASYGNTYYKVTYKDFKEGKVCCEIREVLESYFVDRGKNLSVEHLPREKEFVLSELQVHMIGKRRKIYATEMIYEQIITLIKNKLNSTKEIKFCYFFELQDELINIRSDFWHHYWTGTVYELDLLSIRKEAGNAEQNVEAGYVHQYSLNTKLRYLQEGSNGLIYAMYHENPENCKIIHPEFLDISQLKVLIKRQIKEQFTSDFKDISFSIEFYERYVQILETRLANKKRRALFFPFLLGAFALPHAPMLLTETEVEASIFSMCTIGVFFLLFSLILMPKDAKWIAIRAGKLAVLTILSFVFGALLPSFMLQAIFCFVYWTYHVRNEAIFEV